MRILYVTDLWRGFSDILRGLDTARGMPAFIKPLHKIIEKNNIVELVVIGDIEEKEIDIKIPWLTNKQIVGIVNEKNGIIKVYKLYRKLQKLLINNHYDFIYGHGSIAAVANLVANQFRIPYGQRLYGSFMWSNMLKYGRISGKLKSLLEYSCFIQKKKFLIVTDDGTCGDKVYESIRFFKKDYKFYFWINGVDFVDKIDEINNHSKPFLLYTARIDSWKRQDRAIELLNILHRENIKFYLLFAGHEYNSEYGKSLRALVQEYNLSDYVEFLGAIENNRLLTFMKSAFVNLFFYDVSNKGNAFIESFMAGGVIVALNDGSVNQYIKNGENGFLVNNEVEASKIIISLIKDEAKRKSVAQNVRIDAKKMFKSWDQRVDIELQLILQEVGNGYTV